MDNSQFRKLYYEAKSKIFNVGHLCNKWPQITCIF